MTMGFLNDITRIADSLETIASSLRPYGHDATRTTYYETDTVFAEPGMYNPDEDDMVDSMNEYGNNYIASTSNPYRGWKVFDGEDED
jgi:hypothetical protein